MQPMIDAPEQPRPTGYRVKWTFEGAIEDMRDRVDELDRRLLLVTPEEIPSIRRDFSAFRSDLAAEFFRFIQAHDDLEDEIAETRADLNRCEDEANYEEEYNQLGKKTKETVREFRRTFDWFQSGGRDARDLEDAVRELEAIVP